MTNDQRDLIDELIPYTTYQKPSKQMLVDLINFANRTSMTTTLKSDDVVFSAPVKAPEGGRTNTIIRFTSVKGYKLTGDEEIHYNRLDIDQLASLMNFDGIVEIDNREKNYETTLDLLPELYERFKVYLDQDDIYEDKLDLDFTSITVPKDDDMYGILVTIRVKPTSIGYYGNLQVLVRPKAITLRTAIRTTYMPGFVFPGTHGLS